MELKPKPPAGGVFWLSTAPQQPARASCSIKKGRSPLQATAHDIFAVKDATCQRERPFVPASRKKNRPFKKARTGLRPKQSGHSTGHPGHGTGHLDGKKAAIPATGVATPHKKRTSHTRRARRQTTSPVDEHRTKTDCEDGTPKPKKSERPRKSVRHFSIRFLVSDRFLTGIISEG